MPKGDISMEKPKSRIMIVEDKPFVFECMLTQLNYDVLGIADSSEKALQQVEAGAYKT